MQSSITKHEKNLAAAIHGSTFGRFFFPMGQFLFPLILWLSNRRQSEYVDYHGKQVLNFQISMFLYGLVLGVGSIPFFFGAFPDLFQADFSPWSFLFGRRGMNFHLNLDSLKFPFSFWPLGIGGLLALGIYLVNLVYSILGTLRANEGERFRYPLTLKFIR